MVIIEASSGPCVFIDSAPSMLSPSSICTSALASGPRPMPPYSFGTNGHHSPCARALARSGPNTSASGLLSSCFSAGMHSSCTHWRTLSRIALASAGTSKSIDMAFPRSGLLIICLGGWHISAPRQRQRQTKFEARHPARRKVFHVRSRRPVSRLCLRMDRHQRRARVRARRRQGTAAVVAARLFRNPCDVAPRRAAARRRLHPHRRRPARLWLVGHAGERQGPYALHQARDGEDDGRGDGAARPCAFCAGRARPRRPRRLSPGARSSRPAVAPGGTRYPADLELLGAHEPALCAEDLSLDFSGAAVSVAGNADRRQSGFLPAPEDGEPDQVEKLSLIHIS